MKGYVYITGVGYDPGARGNLHDPELFGPTPTLGACMPNIRRFVEPGDYVFVVSGKTPGVDQYLIGGMRVATKMTAAQAFDRFPSNRLTRAENGEITGNIIADADGGQHVLDTHPPAEFAKRIDNYIAGDRAVLLETPAEVALGRVGTVPFLTSLVGQVGERPIDVIGRLKKLDAGQVDQTLAWLADLKAKAA